MSDQPDALSGLIKVRIEAVGTSELVMSNGILADPDNEYAREIAIITAKGSSMTEVERARKEMLQWRGHLYVDPEGKPAIPMPNLIRCLADAGGALGKGTSSLRPSVERALIPMGSWIPLDYKPGPKTVQELQEDPRFRWRTLVNLNPSGGRKGGKGPKVWPQFSNWGFTTHLMWNGEALDWDKLERVVRMAGLGIGICDARRMGRGRFDGKVYREGEE
jgi:hypothetical protein